MLALGIRYLNGFSAAAETSNRERAEWPPHPGRVFMALAAAHFQTDADPGEREALLWLEGLEAPPLIRASGAIQRDVVKHFVPVNDHNDGYTIKNKKVVVFQEIGQTGVRRERQERTFCRAWPEEDCVFFVWPDAKPREQVRNALERLCAKVTRVGHSASLVQMWLPAPDEIGTPNWVPDEGRAAVRLRQATRGTLGYLERRYNGAAVEAFATLTVTAFDDSDRKAQKAATKRLSDEFPDGAPPQLRPQLSVDYGYAPARDDVPAAAAGTVLSAHLLVVRLEAEDSPYRYLDLACTLALTQRWREALCSQSNDLPNSVCSVLSGHDANGGSLDGPHLAFLPLAFVGHEHSDGRLLGVGLALPDGLSRDDRRGVMVALGRVRHLVLGRLGVWRVEAETASRPAWNLRPETWTAHPEGATHWSTVTPVVYDRHPKTTNKAAYQAEVAEMIREACTRVGLPPPREVIVTPVSAHLGVAPAHSFPRLRRKDDSQRRHTHAILVFDEPVRGPILLGAGRYRGYGLCRPLRESFIDGGEQ